MAIITITVDLTEAELMQLTANSIERVLNNAANIGAIVSDTPSAITMSLREDASSLWQDIDELKPLVSKLWWVAADAARTYRDS